MPLVRWVLIFLFILVMLLVAIQNAEQEVTVRLFTQEYTNVHLALVLYASFAVGMAFVFLFTAVYVLKQKSSMHKLMKENRKIKEELNRLRNANIEDELEPNETIEGE
jgi:uncharacterized membrane protein YciS (DUF1049 family)